MACARCSSGMTPAAGGECAACGPHDTAPFICGLLVAIIACTVLYALYDWGVQTASSHVALQLGISVGLLVGLMQQLSVLGFMSIAYQEPLQTLFRVIKVFAFDLEDVLLLGCIGTMSAASQFVGKVGMILGAIVLVGLIHVLVVLLRHKGLQLAESSIIGPSSLRRELAHSQATAFGVDFPRPGTIVDNCSTICPERICSFNVVPSEMYTGQPTVKQGSCFTFVLLVCRPTLTHLLTCCSMVQRKVRFGTEPVNRGPTGSKFNILWKWLG